MTVGEDKRLVDDTRFRPSGLYLTGAPCPGDYV